MLNVRQPGSFTVAAPFSLIASMYFGMSVGLMSRSTALTNRPPDWATASRADSCSSETPASNAAQANSDTRIVLFIDAPPWVRLGLQPLHCFFDLPEHPEPQPAVD